MQLAKSDTMTGGEPRREPQRRPPRDFARHLPIGHADLHNLKDVNVDILLGWSRL